MRLLDISSAFLLGLIAALPSIGSAETLVVPTGQSYETTDAAASSPFPFASYSPLLTNYPFRYQQVYDASYFGSFADVLRISELRFRVDQGLGDRNAISIPEVDVYLSTTTAEPDALASGSTVAMDGNVGGDSTLVYTGGLEWNACGFTPCPVPQLPPFDQSIVFDADFVYDPSAGKNLLLEVFYPNGPYEDQRFDAVNTGDLMSNAREVVDRDDGTTHIFAPADSLGLVTMFVFTVPEPGATALAAVAFAAIAALRRARA